MLSASRAHLAQAGETYFQHMRFAMMVGALAIGAGIACLIHAIVPALCERTCSQAVGSLQRLFADRTQLGEIAAENSALLLFVLLTGLSCITALTVAVYTAGTLIGLIAIPQAFALPLIFLAGNRGLETSAA